MMDSSNIWNGQDPTLSVSPQDDFNSFLDMGMGSLGESLQFDFQDYSQQGQDTTMQEQMPTMTSTSSHTTIPGTSISGHNSNNESLVDLDAQIQYLQHQRLQQQQRQLQEQQRSYYSQHRMIPPTPNSVEMHAATSQFYPQTDPQHQAMYERYQMQTKEQEMAFTPLVSPAVTPLDAHFNIPEYTIPGAYFSPLSSPALHAQNEHSISYDPRHSGTTNSPIEMNLDSHSIPANSVLSRKSSKRAPPPRPRSVRGVRQSPIVKPRKGKKNPSTSIPVQSLGDILEPSHLHITGSKDTSSSHSTASTEESENGSISPEHLSDMAPPPVPKPGSANRSPFIQAQNNGSNERHPLGSPATPASLMRLTQSPSSNQMVMSQDMDIDDHGMEGFSLPEAVNAHKPTLKRTDTQPDGQMTPTMSSGGSKIHGFNPLPSPAFSRPRSSASASQSPQIDPVNTSNGPSRRTPQLSGRGAKKRSSSSVLASPALLPRISPSIKPLLPGGGSVADDTASLLLASKSNYQNILEGTHLPGVSYPMELSTNLTSKRTSHKIAEQGRRNRINSALQEIATLLPRLPGKDSGGEKSGSGEAEENNETGGGKGGGQSANSKASTVEQAIDYIKQLKQEVEEQKKRAEEAEKRLLSKCESDE